MRLTIASAWVFLFFAISLQAADGSKVFDVRQFGAKGDGKTLDTEAIQKALDECGKATGGTVKFSRGTYYSKPLTLQAKTTVLLDAGATLQACTNQSDFMKVPGDWLQAKSGGDFIPFISGKDLTDVTFTGKGTIDGNGAVWWEEAEKARQKVSGYTLPRPNLIVLTRCKNVRFENLTLQNSPKFHFVPTECEGVVVSNVTILAPEHAANTDAIDPSACKNVLITKCRIDVGDDNVAIKAGKKVEGREFACEDITVTDCTFLHGHGMSIGSETNGGVSKIRVFDLSLDGPDNGIRIKSNGSRGGLTEDVVYDDVCIRNSPNPITLDTTYSAAGTLQGDSLPTMRGITLHNVRVSGGGKITFNGYDHTHRIAATLDGVQIVDQSSYTYELNHADLTLGPEPTNLQLPAGPDSTTPGSISSDSTIKGTPAEGNPASCADKFVPFPQ